MPPELSWNPIRYIRSMLEDGRPTLDDVLAQAPAFGLKHFELYNPLLMSRAPSYLEAVREALTKNGLTLSQLTCAPDFTHPQESERQRHFDDMLLNLETAHRLGAPNVRVTTGCEYPGVPRDDGVRWCVEWLKRLAERAEPKGIVLALENHYRDRRWTSNDFAFHADVYLDVWKRLEDTPVRANFDVSNQIMVNENPLQILHAVKHRLAHVHANDRLTGSYQHTVVGEGRVDWEATFRVLREVNYTGFISLEDGTGAGDEGTRKSLAFLQAKIAQFYGQRVM
ncbi:MAG: sugar phosphate isomerase/epimerase [Planctomycetes bacterium]|nr:sugar phosphate isomerase/epimerase [Planctomycetota bacterium]